MTRPQQHKAPTQVTVVTHEKSAFARWVEKNWRLGALAAVLVSAGILGRQMLREKGQKNASAQWETLRSLTASEDPARILAEAAELPPMQADLARWNAAQIAAARGEYDQALASLAQVSGDNDLLAKLTLPVGGDEELSALDAARRLLEGQKTLEARFAEKLVNPPPPAGGPRVRLETDHGPIAIALYPDQAPKHVENFLARIDDGTYSNLKFHRVEKGRVVQTGDPNTRDGEPSTWGQGGPAERVEPEGKNGLIHVPYAVGMARSGADPKSSGSQFYFTLSRQHQWDEDYTVFGIVEDAESRANLDKIAAVEIAEESRPKTPPVLLSVSRL